MHDAPSSGRMCHAHRRGARFLAACFFVTATLVAGGLAAQQVLMAPEVDLGFDRLQVSDQTDAVEVDHILDQNDWSWASDMGLDLWLGAYTPTDEERWQLEHAEPLTGPKGTVRFPAAVKQGAQRLGLCVVAVSEGGRLAPGMGYVCDDPVVVSAAGAPIDWQTSDAKIGLRFERQVDEQPWYTAARGFERAQASDGTLQTSGDFIVYRAPSPPQPVETTRPQVGYHDRRRDSHMHRDHRKRDWPHSRRDGGEKDWQDDWRDCRRCYGDEYAFYDSLLYSGFGFPRSLFKDDSFRFDRFRHRRLRARQFFGPLDVFDTKFDQDMFTTHPEDVFFPFRLPPGHFGRDAFGRDLQHGFDKPPSVAPRPGFHNLGKPFD